MIVILDTYCLKAIGCLPPIFDTWGETYHQWQQMLRLFNDILAEYVGMNKPVSSPSVGTNKANQK